MSLIPKDLTPSYKATIAKGTGARRWQRPIFTDYLPPCNHTCPAGENIQSWLALAQAGRYQQAWQKYMEENPLPGTHGRACYHPCETACNRRHLDQPVAIHALDRFLGDLASENHWTVPVAPSTGKRVLVIGAGPAGLSCAYHLKRLGHEVEIRDAGAQPGGMLHYGIPAYRLPRAGLQREIDRIAAMGVQITCGHRVADVLAETKAGGFDAVFLGIGAEVGNHLDIPSMDGSKMIHALTLLEEAEQGRAPKVGRVVGIIGAGDTAVDAARVARRLGAEEAVLIYRSDQRHMRAHPEEAKEAFAEGVKVKWMSTVTQFASHEVTVEKMQLLPDGTSTGTGEYETLHADSLVLAVGEHADVEFLKTIPGIRIGRGDVVEVDERMSAGVPGVFAGGDMIGGARTMTAAVGHGKKAARNIDAWLRGTLYVKPAAHPIVPFEALNLPVFLDADRRTQAETPIALRKGFDEVVAGLTEVEARYEANRCLSCGNCFECENCFASCPEQAIVKLGMGRYYRFDYDLCTGCAVCFEQCPCHAIDMQPEAPDGAPDGPAMPSKFKVRA